MAELMHVKRKSEPAKQADNTVANSFIATVYFQQATVLLEQGEYAEAEGYLREVLSHWPDHPGALNNLGTAVWRQGRLKEAEEYHRRALDLAPEDSAILNNIGHLSWQRGRFDEAIAWYRRALQQRPDSPQLLMNLGAALSDVGQFDEAIRSMRESLRLMPDASDSHANLGTALARQGDFDGALECYDHAITLYPDHLEARRSRAYIWLARGDFERGWPEHEWRPKCPEMLRFARGSPRWTGEELRGRSILILAEQGLGDTLQFIRFARLVKERQGQVVVACPKPLARLVARCPGVDRVVDRMSTLPECDVYVPILSLPTIFKTDLASIPTGSYLSVDAQTVAKWRPMIERALAESTRDRSMKHGRVFKIGIAWQGNRHHKGNRWRSFALTHFARLAELPGVRLISLQKGHGTEQLAELAGRFPVASLTRRTKGRKDRRDLLDTAAVISHLDLVITPDSSLAHLAGGLGARVWVALSSVGEWRWLINRDDSPWYPTMRLFRQPTPGDWESVFENMARAISQGYSMTASGPRVTPY